MTRDTVLRSLLLIALLGGATEAQVRPRTEPLLGAGPAVPTAPASPAAAAADALFDDSVLHDIRLDLNAKDWAALKDNYLANTYYPADFRSGGDALRNVGIRSRGTSSRSGVKPGLRVDFNRYSSDQTFLGLKSVILRNNATDASNLHDRISLLFFRRMGVAASRESQATLYVNGTYAGLYSIVESVDKDFLSRTFGDSEGYLYKFDRNVEDLPYYFEFRGPDPALYVPHPFKPETHEADPQPRPIADLIRIAAESSDAAFRTAVAEYLDLAAFVRHVAIESFLAETDGLLGDSGINNFYLYRQQGQRLHVLIPWDKSETLRNPAQPITQGIDDVPGNARDRLMARAWAYDDLRALYLDTLLACAASASEIGPGDERGWLEREIEREFDQIKDAVAAAPEEVFTNGQFIAATNELRGFARQRPGFVAAEVRRVQAER